MNIFDTSIFQGLRNLLQQFHKKNKIYFLCSTERRRLKILKFIFQFQNNSPCLHVNNLHVPPWVEIKSKRSFSYFIFFTNDYFYTCIFTIFPKKILRYHKVQKSPKDIKRSWWNLVMIRQYKSGIKEFESLHPFSKATEKTMFCFVSALY